MVDATLLLANVLKSKDGQKSISKWSEGMKSMKETAEAGGLSDLKDLFDSVQNLLGSPLMIPMQKVVAQLASDVAVETIDKMNRILEAMEGEGTQAALSVLGEIFKLILLIPTPLESMFQLFNWIYDTFWDVDLPGVSDEPPPTYWDMMKDRTYGGAFDPYVPETLGGTQLEPYGF